jgi:hypothetical protein
MAGGSGARAAFCFWGLGLFACSQPPAGSIFSGSASAAGSAAVVAGKPNSAGGAANAGAPQGTDAADALGAAGASAASEEPEADAGFCTGQAVTVAELASGSVREGKVVLLPALVASSQKFLLSASKTSGKCLWAVFAAEEGASGENSGVLLLSAVDGVVAADGGAAECPSGADSLPDDLAPGDRVAAFGAFSDYAPDPCHGTAPMRELLVKPGCAVTKNGHAEPPTAAVLTPDLADRLAQGKDQALLRAWSGARVELENLSALAVDGAPGAVGPFGVIRFQETKLELHSKIPYEDLSLGGPRQPGKSLDFPYPASFERAAGVLFLDYCTWSLEVCDRCADLTPQSRGCEGSGG